MGYQGRDVEVSFQDGLGLVAACDSCGGIGDKELDVVRVPGDITGRFTARVALLEVLAVGARPCLAAAAVCNEQSPTGEVLLKGVRDELSARGLSSLPLAISCEKNMPTRQTGLGITVIGTVEGASLRVATTRRGDSVYCLGLPKVGPEVHSADDPEIVQAEHVEELLNNPQIHDIIPVGSRGISGELASLAGAVGLAFEAGEIPPRLDLYKSGGPSTCLLFTAAPGFRPDQPGSTKKGLKFQSPPLFYLGKLQ